MLKIIPILLALQTIFFIAVNISSASIITSITVKEKDGVATKNYPLTFAIPFKKGEVTAGILVKHNGIQIASQLDVKRRWADSSVKHGIVSVLIPNVAANGTENLTIEKASPNSSTGALDKTAILATDVESVIAMANISGSGNPATASASLRTAINDGNLTYWLQGPICTEILEDTPITANDNLHARWEARFYPGSAFGVRISNIVESTNILATGGSTYDVTINQGNTSPTQVFSFPSFSQGHGARWRRTFWLGTEPPEVEVHYDLNYLSSTTMVPVLDATKIPTESDIIAMVAKTNTIDSYNSRGGTNIDGSGNIGKVFTQPGGRDDLGIIPAWVAYWLLTWDNRVKTSSIVTANAIGHASGAHYREGDASKAFFMRPAVSIDSRSTITFENTGTGFPALVGSKISNGWLVDREHCPGAAYIPYLLTGEHYFLEELQFWASQVLAWNQYRRNGVGSLQDFSSQFPQGYSSGIIYAPERGIAWGMRNINDAAIITPDSDVNLVSYYKDKLANTIKWLDLANSATTGHALGLIRGTREEWLGQIYADGYKYFVAPWMHNFVVIALNDIIRKQEGLTDSSVAERVRDRFGTFTIGTVTNHPTISKWDGVSLYNIPTAKLDQVTYNWTWGELQTAYKLISDVNTKVGNQGSIRTSFDGTSQLTDGEQRFYVTSAALAGLSHLPDWQVAWNFIRENALDSAIKAKPQWGALTYEQKKIAPTIKLIETK